MFHARQTTAEIWTSLWQAWQQCLTKPQSALRYPSLATSGPQGPEQRSLVLRDCLPEPPALLFFTDRRSAKCAEIEEQPLISLHFYEPQERWQVRVKAQASILADESRRAQYWAGVGASWPDYASVDPPGSVYRGSGYLSRAEAYAHFAVLQAELVALEILQIGREEHLRLRLSRKDQVWQSKGLQP